MKQTNLQILAKVLKDCDETDGLSEFLVENFNNQDKGSYTIEGETYYILTKAEVQDILDDEFDDELSEASERLYNLHPDIANIVANITNDDNYKNVDHYFDNLRDYQLIDYVGDNYVYTKD